MCASDFVLIDLWSQRDAVTVYGHGKSSTGTLAWIAKYGSVKPVATPYGNDSYSYIFVSVQGISRAFRLTDNNDLYIFNPYQ